VDQLRLERLAVQAACAMPPRRAAPAPAWIILLVRVPDGVSSKIVGEVATLHPSSAPAVAESATRGRHVGVGAV
jgi:hypothetical protein